MKKGLIVGVFLLLALPVFGSGIEGWQTVGKGIEGWQTVAKGIAVHLFGTETYYRTQGKDQALLDLSQLYFGVFEARKMEEMIEKHLGQADAEKVERRFDELRNAIKTDAPLREVHRAVGNLNAVMRNVTKKLDQAGVPLVGQP